MFEPGDIVFTKGTNWISRAIRFFSRHGGESRTEANHVGIVVQGGSSESAIIVEALSTVRRRPLKAYRQNPRHQVAVFRPLNVSTEGIGKIVGAAESYVGRKYGYIKIVAHLIDWFFGGRYVVRRFTSLDRYPICSWVVAEAYAADGKFFGVAPGQAQPDDIWDFVVENQDKYIPVVWMGTLE